MRLILSLLMTIAAVASMGTEEKKPEYVKVGTIAPVELSLGKTVEVEIPLQVMSGYHIQSNPTRLPQLIPTRLEVSPKQGIKIGKPIYPTGKPYRMPGYNEQISIYDGKIAIKVPLTQTEPLKFRQAQLAATLRYQPCNDKICFFPATVPVLIPVTHAAK